MRGTLFSMLILLLLACVPGGAATPTLPSIDTVNEVRIDNEPRAQAPIPVATLSDLDAVRNDLAGSYVLVADIDASPTAALDYNGGLGWQPIGTQAAPFTGTFDGDGYTITGLTIRRPSEDNVGLFGVAPSPAFLSQINILQASIEGRYGVAVLVGSLGGSATECATDGVVTGTRSAGGIAGGLSGVGITDCRSTVSLDGGSFVGGIVGYCWKGDVTDCSASGDVIGTSDVGGLVGRLYEGTVTRGRACGSVFGYDGVGGLVGTTFTALRDCYATGPASGSYHVGGLAGWMVFGPITGCYASGDVSGQENVGGLVGGYRVGGFGPPLIESCFAAGKVTGKTKVGGFAGYMYVEHTPPWRSAPEGSLSRVTRAIPGTISSSYWNIETSGLATSDGGEGAMGRTTDEMTFPFGGNTYRGWDFVTVWDSGDANNGYPFHRWQTTRYTLHYTAGAHGVLTGPTTQSRIPGATGAPVTAIGLSGYRFDRWNDGSRQNPRADRNVTDDLTVQAEFVETTDAWQLY